VRFVSGVEFLSSTTGMLVIIELLGEKQAVTAGN
jgi:hypothetical protein